MPSKIGGEDFDQKVMAYMINVIKKKIGKDIRSNSRAVQKLRREVERAKRALSKEHKVRLEIEDLVDGQDFSEFLSRSKFEELNMVGRFILPYYIEPIKTPTSKS